VASHKSHKGLSVEGKVKIDTTNRKSIKTKAGVCREFGLVNSTIQTVCQNRTQITSAFERNG